MDCIAPKALNDPAQPLSNWPVAGIVAPRETDRENLEGNNALLKAGCALLTCGNDGTVYLKRVVTTYKENPAAYKGNVADVSMFLRVAVTGKLNSPDMYAVMQILGKDRVSARIENMLNSL